jgi:hypothetical protein
LRREEEIVRAQTLVAWITLLGLGPTAAATHPPTGNTRPREGRGIPEPPQAASNLDGETITTAIEIPGLPYSDEGNTCDFLNDYDEVCPHTGSTAPDVVYAYTPTADESVDITLCNGSTYDTKLYVYENAHTPGNPYACNDDHCPGWISEITDLGLTGGNTYYLVVDGYSEYCGYYVLDIGPAAPPCSLVCITGAIHEGEGECHDEWEDHFNGGCNSAAQTFSHLAGMPDGAPFVVCGTSGTYEAEGLSYRDTDWYELEVATPSTITFECSAEFPLLIFMLDGNNGCEDFETIDDAEADECEIASLQHTFDRGTYWFWVGPAVFAGVPCGSDYVMTITGYESSGAPTASETTWGLIKGMFR